MKVSFPPLARLLLGGASLALAFAALHAAEQRDENMGIAPQDAATMQWFTDAKFGMFLHWGLYAVPAQGEWFMHAKAMAPADYAKFATDQGDGRYFDAKHYDPAEWTRIARDSGMKYMCLTTRHHDGFALFESRHPNAFTSAQTIKRDLVAEYVAAVRAAGIKVGLYFSPINWRYPGYYDVWGTNAAPNAWHYATDRAHKENARVMKEETYEQVRALFSNYGPIDYLFWDGGWLAQQGSDRSAAFFWEPGRYRAADNPWPVAPAFSDSDRKGRALGLMGIVRKYSPRVIANSRSGWVGDFAVEEGPKPVTGPIRATYWEKCLNLNRPSWGYNDRQNLMTYDELVRCLVDVVVRNGNLLLNFGPDRHGRIPESHAALTRQVGAWLERVGDSIYGTRAGPWDPVDGKFGFTFKPGRYYVHLLAGYEGSTFTTPPGITEEVLACRDLYTGKELKFSLWEGGRVHVEGLDRTAHPVDTAVEIVVRPVAAR